MKRGDSGEPFGNVANSISSTAGRSYGKTQPLVFTEPRQAWSRSKASSQNGHQDESFAYFEGGVWLGYF
ncbi:MAG: hypothetical protein AAGJ40_05035 [Planctomycetota bacterium]